ncbi:MAG: 7-carboxy-7-deazaguanine synthase [Phycisphaerae bacterium]|nr:7-carboxy-7-deazaguanine synthase [Phycisphaerae bacterium]
MKDRLRIQEIYRSIQGESSWAGWPCTFIRLTGCHLRCSYCDSTDAFYEGNWLSLDEIVSRTIELQATLVEITGGEPLLQPECGPLAQRLLDQQFTVLCETSGALPINRLPDGVIRIMDLKCPGSGESHRNDWNNIALLSSRDEVKFVIGDRNDFDWAVSTIEQYDLAQRCHLLISPVFGQLDPQLLVHWLLEVRLPARFQIQMHKYVWPPDTRGV